MRKGEGGKEEKEKREGRGIPVETQSKLHGLEIASTGFGSMVNPKKTSSGYLLFVVFVVCGGGSRLVHQKKNDHHKNWGRRMGGKEEREERRRGTQNCSRSTLGC